MNCKLSYQALLVCCILLFSSLGGVFVYAEEYTADYYFKKYAVEFVYTPGVEIAFPSRAQPDETQANTDLNYWVHTVLPFAQDKQADRYLVYPKSGIVLPILVPNAEDALKIKHGEVFNHYPYLEQGGLFYFGSSPSERVGNMVIAAHSSFGKDKAGRYKTIFQALPITRIGDKVFYYEKNSAGSYDMYEYTITDSFETVKTNVSILGQNVDKETLTTYGCYKIGTNDARWVNVGTLTKKTPRFVTLTPPQAHASAPEKSEVAPTPAPVQVTTAPKETAAAPTLTTQSVTTPTTSTPLMSYLLKKKQATTQLSGTALSGSTTEKVTPPAPKTPQIEEMPLSLRILYGPVLNRVVHHLLSQVKFKKAGIQKLIDQFTQSYEATTQANKRHLQGYIIQKLSTFLE